MKFLSFNYSIEKAREKITARSSMLLWWSVVCHVIMQVFLLVFLDDLWFLNLTFNLVVLRIAF